MIEQAHSPSKKQDEPVDLQKMQTKIVISKIIIVGLTLVCCITTIFILAKSSQYFSYLFSLSSQINAKAYLSLYYKPYLCSVYVSIFGFILTISDTIVFFVKFTQKQKILWIHIVYFLLFFISGIVALGGKQYADYMKVLESVSSGYLAGVCTARPYLNECLLAPAFAAYSKDFTNFFAVFTVFFILYVIVYHFAVKKLLPYQMDKKKQQSQHNVNKKESITIQNIRNQTFVSQMFDQYMN